MKETLLMAVDLGTSFIKAGVYNTNSERVAEYMVPVKDYRPEPGVFIQKGEELFGAVLECIKSVNQQLEDRAASIEAIAFTGQMSGFMGVDKNWEDITTWSCTLDTRYMPYAGRQLEKIGSRFLEISGTNFPAMAPKFQWFQAEFPEEAKKIAKYLMISGYVIGKLGNLPIEDAVMDCSFTSWTGLADVKNGRWSDEICGEIGLDQKYLPRIVDSNYICGHLCKEMAAVTGLKEGIPLVSGAGDKISGCLGAAAVHPGQMVFEASSYGEISCCVEEFRPDLEQGRLDILPAAVPGAFFATHFAAGSGITLDWFINSFVPGAKEDLGAAFAEMEKKIARVRPGCDGLMAIGLLGGSSMPLDGDLRGMWMGFDWSHKPEHFYRALLESFTYDFALAMERIDAIYSDHDLSRVRMIGGGAKSPVWAQISADTTGKIYETMSRNDVAMWGACLLAGNAVGIFPDLKKAAEQFIHPVKEYYPDSQMKDVYAKYLNLYRDYLKELKGFYRRVADLQRS